MLSVIAALLCPMMLETLLMSVPDATAAVANVCRRSWNVGTLPWLPISPRRSTLRFHAR